MPTAPSTSQSDVNSTDKRSPARRSATRPSRAAQTGTRPKRAKATSTRARSAAAPSINGRGRASGRASDRSTGVFGDYAERAILIPVGAALIARERVTASVNETISSYSSSSKAQAQLRRFERRGATARSRLEREVRKARVRIERELRHRRREIERTVGDLEGRREAVAKNSTDLANRVPELVNQVQERILSLV